MAGSFSIAPSHGVRATLWAVYLIRERGMSDGEALTHGRAIHLTDDARMDGDRQPFAMFLARPVQGLRRPRAS
jgi:hypothetical protein